MIKLTAGSIAPPDTSLRTVNGGASTGKGERWAVILAGGEGSRLRPLTRMMSGDERPKQFCKVLGDETLLDQTRRRVALAVRPAQTLFVLTKTHEQFYGRQFDGVDSHQLVVQPENSGTAPAILYSLCRLARIAPTSSVAFFPSDHYFSDDRAFMAHVESAFSLAGSRDGDAVILLGIKPDRPEGEYGWIEPVSPVDTNNTGALCRVHRFWEKPAHDVARALMRRGCLWNSFVMVGRTTAFLEMIRRASPELFDLFKRIDPYLNTSCEERLVGELYSGIRESNFSQEVLAARPEDLSVLPVAGLRWSDLGLPQRVLSAMADLGLTQGRRQGFRA
ncbi:MAG: NTP transferase domain-containing protein [Pyrinomonadaceae bacterium]|nr:NTP transferase domain-containing protein [Pyrinomonadaceae bacterium]